MTQSKGSISRARVPSRASLIPTLTPWDGKEKSESENCKQNPKASVIQSLGKQQVPSENETNENGKPNVPVPKAFQDVAPSLRRDLPNSEQKFCWACGGKSFWRSRHGPHLICGGCHPPPFPSYAVEWIDVSAIENRTRIKSLERGTADTTLDHEQKPRWPRTKLVAASSEPLDPNAETTFRTKLGNVERKLPEKP